MKYHELPSKSLPGNLGEPSNRYRTDFAKAAPTKCAGQLIGEHTHLVTADDLQIAGKLAAIPDKEFLPMICLSLLQT
jgi:hypothetical protein